MRRWRDLVDFKFLLGEGNEFQHADEWILPVNDTWDGVFEKDRASHQRILELGYPYVFHISLDCYPVVPRLLAAFENLQGRDYVGTKSGGGDYLGEAGYWLSRRAMEIIAAAPAAPCSYDDQRIGEILAAAGIRYHNTPEYASGDQQTYIFPYQEPRIWCMNSQCSVHLGRGSGTFQPQWMLDCHRSYVNAQR